MMQSSDELFVLFLHSFGCGISGPRTGIIFNSGIDDFSFANRTNYFDLPATVPNSIVPQKQAVTSMAPTIVVGANGSVQVVIGAAGGSKIPSAIAMVRTSCAADVKHIDFMFITLIIGCHSFALAGRRFEGGH